MPSAFDSFVLGRTALRNRIVMSPMTRSRAYGPGSSPTELMATYYAQRASAGLIISEGIQPSIVGQGYLNTPGLYSASQMAAWRRVTEAVHAEGGKVFAQLMHTGRVGHPSFLPDNLRPVGPSAVAAQGQVFTTEGLKPFETPDELSDAEIRSTIEDFAQAARNAISAGFDGVELHGANGYLIHQFLSSNANVRHDEWGGSIENRISFAVEVARAVAQAIGADRVGMRISPANPLNDIVEQDSESMYLALVDALAELGLAYLHIMEVPGVRPLTRRLRHRWPNAFILNPDSRPLPTGLPELALIEDGAADLIAFGSLFIANPDLPARLALGGPFNMPDRASLYGGDSHGYTDYPTLAEELAGAPN